ncbi:MAG: diaminopimelate epimerase [Ignavibacterium sp.]|nr:MAG: diaminopimelate epimerase [Ignavibacterium sp.]
MKEVSFIKISGAGNDFIIIDKTQNPEFVLKNDVISQLCHRRNGIGADGIITISNADGYDFGMEYYNADGSTGTLCGNGARCAIKYAHTSNRTNGDTVHFLSNESEYSGELLTDGKIKFNLKPPKKLDKNRTVQFEGNEIQASFIHTGSPHIVIDISDLPDEDMRMSLDNVDVITIGRKIRNEPEFAPSGTNVNFITMADDKIYIRTYERGVEDETLACGTGSVAAAIIAHKKFDLMPPVLLITKCGDELVVNFDMLASEFKNVSLTGPVEEIYKGKIIINQNA